MGPLIWVLNLWSMRIAAGAAVLASMATAAALYAQANAARDKIVAVAEQQKEQQAKIWEGL